MRREGIFLTRRGLLMVATDRILAILWRSICEGKGGGFLNQMSRHKLAFTNAMFY